MRFVHATPMLALAIMIHAASQAKAEEKTALAVLDLKGQGVSPDLTASLTDLVAAALTRLDVFRVLSRADLQQLLAFEQDKQLLGCESDTSCLAELGGALGVALLVSGSVGKVGEEFLVNLTLTESSSVRVLARETRQVPKESELAAQIEGAARILVRSLLDAKQGDLILKASESGSDVEVDGRLVGMTPLPRQALSGGPHTLRVVKKGFVTWVRDISINPGQPVLVEAAQIPSLEFIADYDQRARTWRVLALAAGGLGAAGVLFAVGGWVWNGGRANAYERDLLAANCQEGAAGPASASCPGLADRRSSIRTFDVIAQVSGLLGAVALGASAYLFWQGPSPGAYDVYKAETGVTAGIGFAPLARGILAMGTVSY